MSMMIPDEAPVEIKASIPVKIAAAAKKTSSKLFHKPAHYLFYLTLAGLIVGLFTGNDFSWKLWTISFGLGVVELYTNFSKKDGQVK